MFGETLRIIWVISPPQSILSWKGSDEIPDRAHWEDGEMGVWRCCIAGLNAHEPAGTENVSPKLGKQAILFLQPLEGSSKSTSPLTPWFWLRETHSKLLTFRTVGECMIFWVPPHAPHICGGSFHQSWEITTVKCRRALRKYLSGWG